DAGDPFPGATFRDDFDLGGDKPLRLTGITERGETITADLAIGFTGPALVASPAEVRLTATASADPVATHVVAVRREGGATGMRVVRSRAPRSATTSTWAATSRSGGPGSRSEARRSRRISRLASPAPRWSHRRRKCV